MIDQAARVYTIAPGGRFLDDLASEILKGFPFGNSKRISYPLPQWTILLPTRKSARVLGSLLMSKCSGTVLLPTIRPIGDIDDDRLNFISVSGDIPNAISRTGHIFLLLDILKIWAKQNPQISLAKEIRASEIQSLALANSLLKLVDQVETEEVDFEHLSEAYNSDLSDHRNAIISLLSTLKIELPASLSKERLIGPSARRSLLLRLEAQRISSSKLKGPIIGAGSTGTIPATRALLKAIAHNPLGAVVVPGLDVKMSAEDWTQIGLDHPQFALQNLVAELGVVHSGVVELGHPNIHRNALSTELMRPSSSTEMWHKILPERIATTNQALQGLSLIEAPDRHIEARAIALKLRHALETPSQTAALITPDRDLAKRVKSELQRWNIDITDSAGEQLSNHGMASLACVVLQASINGFKFADVLTLLSHHLVTIGESHAQIEQLRQHLEFAILRGYGSDTGLSGLEFAFERALEAKRQKMRLHILTAALTEDDWLKIKTFIRQLNNILLPLVESQSVSTKQLLARLETALKLLAPETDWQQTDNKKFLEFLGEVSLECHRLSVHDFAAFAFILLPLLREQKIRLDNASHPRLAIYGVLEARFMPADILILGGLNEGIWPAQPDTGPWLNRSMRKIFAMQLPERDIGVAAHDFTQAFGYEKLCLTWSQKLEGSPQIPSRWILRLQTLLEGSNISKTSLHDTAIVALAKALDDVKDLSPQPMPRPKPVVTARPTRFSVTEVERLIRDPYAVYARKILKLEPLQDISREPDAALRGTLFHNAIALWNQSQPHILSNDSLNILLRAGENTFASLVHDPEIAMFWTSRFKRIADWLAAQEPELRSQTQHVVAELEGEIKFLVSGINFTLTARADRIDLLFDGSGLIIDYKSGTPPSNNKVVSGISPQLPLEAAILAQGGFKKLQAARSSQLKYIHISGRSPVGKITTINSKDGKTAADLANDHLTGFKVLLGRFCEANHPYMPRLAIEKEEDPSDFDHLSRHQEWLLSGQS